MAAAQLSVNAQTTDAARTSAATALPRVVEQESRPAVELDLRRQSLGRCWGA